MGLDPYFPNTYFFGMRIEFLSQNDALQKHFLHNSFLKCS